VLLFWFIVLATKKNAELAIFPLTGDKLTGCARIGSEAAHWFGVSWLTADLVA
jgi:hypothetical protein